MTTEPTDHIRLELDGEIVIISIVGDDALDEVTRRELAEWAQVPEEEGTRSGDLDPFAITALFGYAISGVVGNFTYDLFPHAYRYLEAKLRRSPEKLDADGAAAAVLAHVRQHWAGPGESIELRSIEEKSDGSWKAKAKVSDGRSVKVRMAPDGSITHIERR